MTRHRKGRGHGYAYGFGQGASSESVVLAKIADALAAKAEPEPAPAGETLAKMLIERLDGDGSGALNSEEIAGTRLAEKIGDKFYGLDGDKSGTLDVAELRAFIEEAVLGLAEPADEAEDADDVEVDDDDAAASVVSAATSASASVAEELTELDDVGESDAVVTAAASSFVVDNEKLNGFEAALKLLEDSAENRQTYDVISTFYERVKAILAA